ncbi:hypothetical protein WKW79_03330 [Variovorax robiniae]|uniref:DUF2486 domain-containing protein n=1 Tax=Variovorax robiniae TaxID=1836199 RepID=A0ABU8X4G3_9BURK
MAGPTRTPPRFVPTLTTVVEPSSLLESVPAEAVLAVPAMPPASTAESPPAPAAESAMAFHSAAEEQAALRPTSVVVDDEATFRFEEGLLHRVLQRIDLSLEARLTDTVSAAVQQQLDAMLPRLRAEIEGVLRELVVDALARELAENPGSTTGQST